MGETIFLWAVGTILLMPLAILAACGCILIIKSTIDFLRGAKECWYCNNSFFPKEKTEHARGICDKYRF